LCQARVELVARRSINWLDFLRLRSQNAAHVGAEGVARHRVRAEQHAQHDIASVIRRID
jgi:hypothetical protein